jgi:2-methylcitrate dehydratase PrpD
MGKEPIVSAREAAEIAGPGLTRRLAAFVAGSRLEDIPEHVRAHGVRALFNGFGTALGGSSDQAIERLAVALADYSSAPVATVVGRSRRFDAPTAAFLNAAAMNVFDFDDTHADTIIHPTAPVAPVALALAETRRLTGAELLHAFILGAEITCRLGNAISPGHYARGWHITATCGVFGAAIAASKLLGLDEEQLVWALGNAAAQSSGLVETLGFMAKSVGVGGAARNGLMSALMAEAGVEGPPCPIEGPRGFLTVTCDAPRPARVAEALGADWEILRDMFKPYPCGVVLNPVIDACLAARVMPGFEPERVARVTVRGNPLLKARADRPHVTTGREAQVSAQHAIAVSLLHGAAGAAEFSDAAVADAETRALRSRVTEVEVDERIPVEAAELEVVFTDGETISLREDNATGSLTRPMSDSALRAKFAALTRHGRSGIDPAPLADMLWRLPELPDVGALMACVRPSELTPDTGSRTRV